jgi:hypothetical protein
MGWCKCVLDGVGRGMLSIREEDRDRLPSDVNARRVVGRDAGFIVRWVPKRLENAVLLKFVSKRSRE